MTESTLHLKYLSQTRARACTLGDTTAMPSSREPIRCVQTASPSVEAGQKRVSPERAVRLARVLGHSEIYFVQLALQDLVNDAGVPPRVVVTVAGEAA